MDNTGQLRIFHEQGSLAMMEVPEKVKVSASLPPKFINFCLVMEQKLHEEV